MRGVIDRLGEFLRLESAASVLLIGAAALALLFANSPLAGAYTSFLQLPIAVQVGDFVIHKPLLLWVNDGLMALFFFLVGLELKREFLDGELSRPEQLVLPFAGALGGMLAPALVYLAFNHADPVAARGWAIPAATDIAFALGVLALLGSRVPLSLKLLLMSIAIFDDLGAIIIIALFYSADLAPSALAVAGLALAGLITLNRRGVRDTAPYLLLGLVMWAAVLKSGVHATLAGALLALTIPAAADDEGRSPLRDLEHGLHPSVAFGVLPLFAFANAGVMLTGLGVEAFTAPVPAGIALGLLVGKPLGVFGLMAAAVALRLAPRPADAGWGGLLGVACLCGVGFTMSLFIGSLAFEQGGPDPFVADRLGILAGSLGAALLGLAVLHLALPRRAA